MPVLPAAILVVFVAAVYLSKTSTKLPATITLAKPTTVVPAGVVFFAAIATLLVVLITREADAGPLWVLGLAGLAGFLIISIGGKTTGSRMVYDRGGLRMPPGKLIGVAFVALLCFLALTQNR